MSFKATLFIFEKEYPLIDIKYNLKKMVDNTGRPTTRTHGGSIQVQFAATRDDSGMYEAMLSPTQMVKGYIRTYRRDGIQKDFDIEFANAFISYLKEHFNAASTEPIIMEVTISPMIQRIKGTIFELPANPSNPFIEEAAPTVREDGKELTAYFITDELGNEIEEYEIDQTILLHIETKNRIGHIITINLDDNEHDFKYNGAVLKNDTIKDFTIGNNLEVIELEVIEQQEA